MSQEKIAFIFTAFTFQRLSGVELAVGVGVFVIGRGVIGGRVGEGSSGVSERMGTVDVGV